ncbi:MAG: hypothetical protein JWL70_3148 [Acidimicrobiia bacterium]|nr:hypothetical protein [Acidimicrobiia bacterium]
MDIVLWIVSGLLAAAFIFAGSNKVVRPKEKLVGSLPWSEDFSPATIKSIGAVEVLGGIGVILPWLTNIAPVLTPLAATGLALVQLLALIVHVRRHEPSAFPVNAVLGILATFVAVFRFAAL